MAAQQTLQDLIDSSGLSLGEVSERSGLAPHSIRKLRLGLVTTARSTTVSRLAHALRVPAARVRAAIEASRARRDA